MICELQLQNILIEKLKTTGYPEESIVLEYNYKGLFQAADLAIVPYKAENPIALFEFKMLGDNNIQKIKKGLENLIKQSKKFPFEIPCFLVTNPPEEKEQLTIYDVTTLIYSNQDFNMSTIEKCKIASLPPYKALLNNANAKIQKTNKYKKKKYGIGLKFLCWAILPVLSASLLTLDALSIYTLTTERLILLGVSTIILFIPFFSKLTIKDISFVFDKSNKNKYEEE